MRTYLVVLDDTAEAQTALRFAGRRALATDGQVHIIAVAPKQDFVAFGGIQATIEEEARDRAEVQAMSAAGNLFSESGRMPKISVRMGKPEEVIGEYLAENDEVTALVLGAAGQGNPGPLVTHFAANASALPCPLIIVPEGVSATAET